MEKIIVKSNIRIPKKKPKKTRSEISILNAMHMGPEPQFAAGHVLTYAERAKSYGWYSYMCDADDAREYAVEWLDSIGQLDLATKLATVPNQSFPLTPSWIARLASIGCDVGEKSKEFALEHFKTAAEKYSVAQDESVVTIKSPAEEKMYVFLSDMETYLDKKDFSSDVYAMLAGNSFPTSQVSKIGDYYEPLLEELKSVGRGKDQELTHAYRHVPPDVMKNTIKWLTHLIDSCSAYAGNAKMAKVAKAPRAKKQRSTESKLKHFECMKEFPALKIKSVEPETIIGARELWCYDTKYRAMIRLVAPDGKSLSVKGKSVVDYDEAQSKTVVVGNHAQRYVDRVRETSKSNMAAVLKDVKNRVWPKAKNRISTETILLRVIR